MYGFQYIHLKARGSQVGAPREGPRRAGRRGGRALLVEREGRRRDEDESRGVRDRSRSPERGGGGGRRFLPRPPVEFLLVVKPSAPTRFVRR